MSKLSRTDECVTVGRCKIICLLSTYDFVLLAFSESSIQHAFNRLGAACDTAGMKTSTSTTEVLHLSRNPVQ